MSLSGIQELYHHFWKSYTVTFSQKMAGMSMDALAEKAGAIVSKQAIMAQAARLEIITENGYRSFCIYASTHGWKKEEPGSYKGKEVANRFKQLVYHAAAEQIISFNKAACFLNKSLEEFDLEVHFVS